MKHLLSTSAVALMVSAGAALAGGPVVIVQPPVIAAPPAPAFDWTGAYVGVHGGMGTLSDGTILSPFDINPIGVHAGYLHDFGSVVAGAELSYSYFSSPFPAVLSSTQVKARLGFDGGRFMPYVTGGVGAFYSDAWGADMTYLLGGGVEAAISDHFRIGGEYLWENNPTWQAGASPVLDMDIHTFVLRASYAF